MYNRTDIQRRNSNFEIILAIKTSSHIINFSQQKKACEHVALLWSQTYMFVNLVFLLYSVFLSPLCCLIKPWTSLLWPADYLTVLCYPLLLKFPYPEFTSLLSPPPPLSAYEVCWWLGKRGGSTCLQSLAALQWKDMRCFFTQNELYKRALIVKTIKVKIIEENKAEQL